MSNTDVPMEPTISSTKNETSEPNISKIMEIKERLSIKLDNIENDISKIEELKQTSIEEIENKKTELRELLNPEEISKEHSEALKELAITGTEIEARKFSITKLEETITNLDLEIARIQSEHDKAVAELKEKWRKLNEQLEYYEKLNTKIAELAKMIKEKGEQFDDKLKEMTHKRSELLKRTDLSETTLNRTLRELEDQIETLKEDHDIVINAANESLLDYTTDQGISEKEDELLTAGQIKEIETFEKELEKSKEHRLSKEERLSLLKQGLQITPSGRIITQDDKVLRLEELKYLGYLSYDYFGEEEEQEEDRWTEETWEKQQVEKHDIEKQEVFVPERRMIYSSVSSVSTSTIEPSSKESGLSSQDTEYLKQIFGKSLSLALAEITAVQPADPIHYLAHWLFKYRYNQEIDDVKKKEVEALIEERKRIAAEKWHLELEEEALLAIQEVLFRVENVILQKEYALMRLVEEIEGENEAEIPHPSQLALID